MNNRKKMFPEVSDADWNDWHWQVNNRIETLEQLKKYVVLTEEEENGVKESLKTLRMAITPYYLTLIDTENPCCPVRRQAIPTFAETHQTKADLLDPLHEDGDSPAPGLTHRYPDRVLFLVTDMCSMYCRHCTRRRFSGQKDTSSSSEIISASPPESSTSRTCGVFSMYSIHFSMFSGKEEVSFCPENRLRVQ